MIQKRRHHPGKESRSDAVFPQNCVAWLNCAEFAIAWGTFPVLHHTWYLSMEHYCPEDKTLVCAKWCNELLYVQCAYIMMVSTRVLVCMVWARRWVTNEHLPSSIKVPLLHCDTAVLSILYNYVFFPPSPTHQLSTTSITTVHTDTDTRYGPTK